MHAALYAQRYSRAVLKLFMRKFRTGRRPIWAKASAFTFFDAGHILGSAYVLIEWTEGGRNRSLLFTGDVGRYDTPILRDPQPIPGAGGISHHRKHLWQRLARPDGAKSARSFSTP